MVRYAHALLMIISLKFSNLVSPKYTCAKFFIVISMTGGVFASLSMGVLMTLLYSKDMFFLLALKIVYNCTRTQSPRQLPESGSFQIDYM